MKRLGILGILLIAVLSVFAQSKKVKVTVQKIATTKITGVDSPVSVKRGKTITLRAKAYPTNSDYGITYTSQNKSIATVTSKGVVKGIKAGTTYIVVKSGTVTKKVKVTVKK